MSQWKARSGTASAIAAAIVATPMLGTAQAPEVVRAIDAYVAPYVATNNFSGQLLVMPGSRVVYDRQFGAADRERGTANARDTRFHIASVSMQLRFESAKNELFRRWPSGEASPIIPLDTDHLLDRAFWEPIGISRDSAGRATGMTYDRFIGTRVAPSDSTRR